MRREGDVEVREEPGADRVDAVIRALPELPIDPGFSARTLRVARAEFRAGGAYGAWHRAGRFARQVAVPAMLVACAAGYVIHYIQVAERVYVSHGAPGL